MLRLRFLRVGRKNDPSFRLVVAPRTMAPSGGQFLDIVGFYNPRTKQRQLKEERIKYWLGRGVQPSDSVHNMLISAGILKGQKVAVHAAPPLTEKKEEGKIEEKRAEQQERSAAREN